MDRKIRTNTYTSKQTEFRIFNEKYETASVREDHDATRTTFQELFRQPLRSTLLKNTRCVRITLYVSRPIRRSMGRSGGKGWRRKARCKLPRRPHQTGRHFAGGVPLQASGSKKELGGGGDRSTPTRGMGTEPGRG